MSRTSFRLALAALGVAAAAASGTASQAAPHGAVLTQATADAAMHAYVLGKAPHAALPTVQLPYCPGSEIDDAESNPAPGEQFVLCIAEYHVGTKWGSIAANLKLVHGVLLVSPIANRTWTRRWVTCTKPREWTAPVISLESNNDCGDHSYGGNDWYLSSGLYTDGINANGAVTTSKFDPAATATGWDWTNSNGYAVGGYERTARHGNVYTYTNVVGDAFRIRP